MCQVEGCNNKGIMVNGIALTDKTYGSITLDIFLCEEHNDDPIFLATEWISNIRLSSGMITEEISFEREPRVKERKRPGITSPKNRSINSQRNASSSSNTKRPRLKRNLPLP